MNAAGEGGEEKSRYAYLNTGNKNNITIRHLLTMTSGFQWNEWDVTVRDSQYDLVIFNQAPDPMAYLLGKPLVAAPGTTNLAPYSHCQDGSWFQARGTVDNTALGTVKGQSI